MAQRAENWYYIATIRDQLCVLNEEHEMLLLFRQAIQSDVGVQHSWRRIVRLEARIVGIVGALKALNEELHRATAEVDN